MGEQQIKDKQVIRRVLSMLGGHLSSEQLAAMSEAAAKIEHANAQLGLSCQVDANHDWGQLLDHIAHDIQSYYGHDLATKIRELS